MNLFQEFFVTAMVALIFSCIIVKFVSAAVLKDGKIDHKEKYVVEETKITKGLVVKSRKSKKRVKFVEQEVVGNVDCIETQQPNKVGGVVDQSKNASGEEVFVEKKIEGILRKDDDFKGEKILENLDLIEHCGGEREVSDGHDDGDMSSKIGLLEENDEVKKIEKKIEDILEMGDDFKGEKIPKNLGLIEHCGGEREVSDGHGDAFLCGKIGLLEEKDEVKNEKNIEGILKKGDDFKGEKVPENLGVIEHCGGEREVSDGHDDASLCGKIGLLEEKDIEVKIEKKIEGILEKGDDFKGVKTPENIKEIEQCDGHEDTDMSCKIGLLEEMDEVKKIDELLFVKEEDITNDLVVDEVELGENKVVEIGEGLSKETDTKVMYEDSDDDWEGIERSELEEEFVKAVNFVDEGNGKENLGSESMMQLYGLQKIAMEGPCHEPQPMALKVYARAKWNAWQKMGSMNPEVAMEQYIKLLSDNVPRWTHHSEDDCEVGSSKTKMPGDSDSIPDSFNDISKDERTQEVNRAAEGDDFPGGEKDKE
ncbi:acyl-CoA-binding domain-containing protein 5-like isoform X1 [Lycium barbarum]|uniref:acyl-CoA-binding domain-containing protein 5-like isoform X1 n=1 Tax=Lycium barbarum TaxID=112863 RepID=UPI00293F641C|nr:acyl-CoA-binding domain-containing protein 5-like isoform X1 [Lycium barbarum]